MIKEESLKQALAEAGLIRGLPHQYNEKKDPFWIRAIVLVQKRSMEESYCIYEQNADRYMKLLYDFGGASPIFGIKGIYPYLYLDETNFMPKGGAMNERQFLKSEMGDRLSEEEIDNMSDAEVKREIINEGIRIQLMNRDIDREQNAFNEGSDLDGTVVKEVEEARFEAEYAALFKDGVSMKELNEMRYKFEHRNDEKPIEIELPDEAELLREEMENGNVDSSDIPVSVEGEFDAPVIDYSSIRKAREDARHAALEKTSRKSRRNREENQKKREGTLFENEYGEVEAVEVAFVPKSNTPIEKKKEASTKKRGRPRLTEEEKAARQAKLERARARKKRTAAAKTKKATTKNK